MIKIKNINQKSENEDGFRILMDNSLPKGVSKEDLRIDIWLRDLAPSNELCEWFAQDPNRWPDFKEKYQKELKFKKTLISIIKKLEKEKGTVTLVYGSRNDDQNSAVVLRDKIMGYGTVYTHISRIHG